MQQVASGAHDSSVNGIPREKPSNAKAIIVTAVITFVATSLVWAGIGTFLYRMWTAAPPAFEVTVEHPPSVTVGETLVLKINTKNTSEKELRLGSIDVYNDLLDGFHLISESPKPVAKENHQDFASFYFEQAIQPEETFSFLLKLEAKTPGFWAGDVDSCTPLGNYITAEPGIEVMAKP